MLDTFLSFYKTLYTYPTTPLDDLEVKVIDFEFWLKFYIYEDIISQCHNGLSWYLYMYLDWC